MNNSIKVELKDHILGAISAGIITDDNIEDLHFHCFNENYYIIGYYNCSEWLKKHNIDVFEAIATCQDYEKENFGEITNKYDNSEQAVNMLAYIYGEQLISELDFDNIKELKEALK